MEAFDTDGNTSAGGTVAQITLTGSNVGTLTELTPNVRVDTAKQTEDSVTFVFESHDPAAAAYYEVYDEEGNLIYSTENGGSNEYTAESEIYMSLATAGYATEYYGKTNSGYALLKAENGSGLIGQTVTAVVEQIDGYVHNASAAGSVLSGTIKADSSLTLKVYYDKVQSGTEPGQSGGSDDDGPIYSGLIEPVVQQPELQSAIVICRNLNVRATPGTQKSPVDMLHRGEQIEETLLDNGWFAFELDGVV